MQKKLLSFILFILISTAMFSQENTVSSGGNATGTTGTSTFTVGQVFYSATVNTNGSSIEGMQQPFDIKTLTNPDVEGVDLSVSTYPNPTTDRLTLFITTIQLGNLRFHLHDIRGKLIIDRPIIHTTTTVEMGALAQGTYILSVKKPNKILKSFKIIKR